MNRSHYHRAPKESQDALVGRYPCSEENRQRLIIGVFVCRCQSYGCIWQLSNGFGIRNAFPKEFAVIVTIAVKRRL
jgi:hypothetical protein